MDDVMTTKEMTRLAAWMLSHGFTERDALECLQYISGESELPEVDREKGHAPHSTESVT